MHFRLHRDRTGIQSRIDRTSSSNYTSPAVAFSFIVRWNGDSVVPLLEAIHCVREKGGPVMQDYLRKAMADLCRRIPMPADIPLYVSSPILAADRNGKVLIGWEGHEQIVEISSLRQDLSEIQKSTTPVAKPKSA
jgi:hypothetical protein